MKRVLIASAVIGLSAAAIVSFWSTPTMETQDQPVQSEKANIHIESFHLSNGMEVVMVPNHRTPAVSHILWLKIGAADDPPGKSGLAHYLEHLMFKGTPNVPDGEYSSQIAAMGGSFNAFTAADFTGYYVNIAKQHLPTVMKLEADRFQHLAPPQDVFTKERDVIIEERRSRIENYPGALLAEEVMAVIFRHHPYRVPIIGWKHEMEKLTLDDALAFYREHYHPGNLVLIVAGDITREELKPLAEQYYGSIPAKPAAKRDWVQEPPERGTKLIRYVHEQVRQPKWSRHYIAPTVAYGDTEYAQPLGLLSHWLGGSKTSLLYRELVENQRIASSASTNYSALKRGPDVFSITVTPAEGVSMKQIEQAVSDVIRQALEQPIKEKDLKRVKTLMKAEAIYAQDGLQPIAHWVGYIKMLGLDASEYVNGWTDIIDAITPEQIQKAAVYLLGRPNHVTAHLLPVAKAIQTKEPEVAPKEAEDKTEEKSGAEEKK